MLPFYWLIVAAALPDRLFVALNGLNGPQFHSQFQSGTVRPQNGMLRCIECNRVAGAPYFFCIQSMHLSLDCFVVSVW